MTAALNQRAYAEADSLDSYVDDVCRYPLLTAEQEHALASRVRAGDESAVDQLVCSNLRFVVAMARQYRDLGVPIPALINTGNLALLRAAQRFDGTKCARFFSYAISWVRRAMLRTIVASEQKARAPELGSPTITAVVASS